MARTCEKPGRAVRFAAPSERPFARHWYTGVRFLDVIFERFLNAQKHRSRWSLAKLCSTRGRCPERPTERQNPDCKTLKRATTVRDRGAPVREARILGRMGWGGGGGFLRARSGAGRRDWQTGKRAGREREGGGKGGGWGSLRFLSTKKRRYRRGRAQPCGPDAAKSDKKMWISASFWSPISRHW